MILCCTVVVSTLNYIDVFSYSSEILNHISAVIIWLKNKVFLL